MNRLLVCSSFLAFCFVPLAKPVSNVNSEGSFSITIKSSVNGTITLNGKGDKLTRGFISKKQMAIMVAFDGASGDKPTGDNILLNIFGETSGDYKFDFNRKTEKPNGHAFFQFNPTTAAATKLGYLYSSSGVLHLTISSNSCSGTIEAKSTNNCVVTGSFNNIPLQEKN